MTISKVILVTAGASGIGRCIAENFLKDGSAVHICDINSDYINDFLESNPMATASQIDVSNFDEVKTLFEDIKKIYGKLDVLINNAGIPGVSSLLEDAPIDDWNQTIEVNLNGMFYVTKLAVPFLKANKIGSIINMASTAGLMGVPNRSPYVASKWAIVGLTKTLAMELGPLNINVNAVCPGCVEGDRIRRVIEADARSQGNTSEEIEAVYLRQSSMRLFVDKADVANMVLFLASKNGHKISGQAIALDGNTEGLFNWLDS